MRNRIIQITSLSLNILIVVFTMISFLYYQFPDKSGYVVGLSILKYFTMDSNILVAVSSAILIPYNILNITKNRFYIPRYASILKYMGTVSVALTFLTVIFFLGPTQGFNNMYNNVSFFMHMATPILSIISYTLFEGIELDQRVTITSIIPMVIYGMVYMTNVVYKYRWNDFYGFNINGKWRITFLIMLLVTYLIGVLIYFLPIIFNRIMNNIQKRKRNKQSINNSNN